MNTVGRKSIILVVSAGGNYDGLRFVKRRTDQAKTCAVSAMILGERRTEYMCVMSPRRRDVIPRSRKLVWESIGLPYHPTQGTVFGLGWTPVR